MGISVEQYRSRIGSHDNFVKTKDALSRFKDRFWNIMLMMFYMNVFYLPTLKKVVAPYKIWNEVVFWFTQFMYYNVYMPLLLRLANDVEENPGPAIFDIVDPTRTVSADYSQGDEVFGENAGKQCVGMSLSAIIYHHLEHNSLWRSSTLNRILTIGNTLYTSIRCSVQTNDYLLLTDVPSMVSIYNKVFTLQYSDSLAGSLHLTSNHGPYMSLEDSLRQVFLNYNCCLLTVGISTIAVFKNSERSFKIFDSHSKDLLGMPSSFGKCTLLYIEGVENLVSYLQISPLQTGVVPFEIRGVFVSDCQIELPSVCENQKSGDMPIEVNPNETNERKRKCSAETPEEKEKRLIAKRKYEKNKKANESEECKQKRLAQQCLRSKKKRANETSDAKKRRLASQCHYQKEKAANESVECRENRLAKKREYWKEKAANESVECRQNRLAKKREYQKDKIANECAECRQKRLGNMQKYQKDKIANESTKSRQKRLLKAKRSKQNILSRSTIADEITKFHVAVSKGPFYICSCCDQLWYRHSVTTAEKVRLSNPIAGQYLLNKRSVDNLEWICSCCYEHLKKGKIPPCAAKNGMLFPVKPEFFDLNELEWRLLAPRLAFQKILQAPRGNQLKIKGNVVNVPADVNNTVNILPRLPQESGTIKINLKRRLKYKSSALSLNVRPNKVLQAAMWLATNSTLYREQGISFSEDRAANYDFAAFSQNQAETGNVSQSDELISDRCNIEIDDDNSKQVDDWTEDDVEIPAGVTDTMLTANDFLEDSERPQIYSIAPGETSVPLSIFRDGYPEELAYPGIFLGQKRSSNEERAVPVHYSDICKPELRRSDRRAAKCVENIFFKTKKLQMKILLGKSQIALRKCKGNQTILTAGQLKQEGALERLIHLDEGYKFLRALRGSPPYFEKAKKDIFAMIRQLGPANLFCSFSSAETQWIHLLRILGKLVDDKDYTDDELENLNWEEKSRLIQSDPVTCARHFDYQFNQFLRHFLMSNAAPLGKISDWFYRVEYQQRGSPHIHMLVWLEDAPVYGRDSDDDITSFIDQIIICEKPANDPKLAVLVNRQIHRHSQTCRKKSKMECRFNYPQPPMKSTSILYPIGSDVSESDIRKHKENWKNISKHLNDMKEGDDITFEEMLVNLNISEQNYYLAIRSSLNSPTIFLKRNPNELRINNYNSA